MLCSLVLDADGPSLNDVAWTVGDEFDVVSISIDPEGHARDRDAQARAGRRARTRAANGAAARDGTSSSATRTNIRKVTDAVGFKYNYDARQKQYAHPAAIYLLTPDGHVARYLYGIEYPAGRRSPWPAGGSRGPFDLDHRADPSLLLPLRPSGQALRPCGDERHAPRRRPHPRGHARAADRHGSARAATPQQRASSDSGLHRQPERAYDLTMNEPNAPATFQLPEQMSTVAGDVDWLYYFIYWLSVVLFVGDRHGAMIYLAIKYREREGHKAEPTGHNMPLEIAWTVAPLFILVFLFHKGFQGTWIWRWRLPNAIEISRQREAMGLGVRLPERRQQRRAARPGAQARQARDGLGRRHPRLLRRRRSRIKRDVVPGMYTHRSGSRRPTPGKDDIVCAEYCGGRSKGPDGERAALRAQRRPAQSLPGGQTTGHWAMHSMLYVESQEDFDKFVKSIGDPCDEYVSTGKPCPDEVAADQGAEALHDEGLRRVPHDDGREAGRPLVEGHLGKSESTDHGARDGRRKLHPRVDPRRRKRRS